MPHGGRAKLEFYTTPPRDGIMYVVDRLRIDLHDYHPDDIDIANLLRQAWETGCSEVVLIHGHGRARGRARGFYNTNTGYFGRRVRTAIRGNRALKPWVKISTLDCSRWGSTLVKLKPNPNPTRTEIDLPRSRYER
jgi:hypothetical protein